jgi:hypothetical protein
LSIVLVIVASLSSQEACAVLATDEPQTTTTVDPELLIEEARQRQRRRQRRKLTGLVGVILVSLLGIGISRTIPGDNAASAQNRSTLSAIGVRHAVIYEKVEMVITTPHVPTVRRRGEVWFSTATPWAYRELLEIPGRPLFEVGAATGRDPTLPRLRREQFVYLYDAQTDTIYRTGAYMLTPPQTLRSLFRQFLAQPGVALVGTRRFDSHEVYVARSFGNTSFGKTSETMYVDTTTYQPLLSVSTSPDFRSTTRILFSRTLPATAANLKLTSLAQSHPRARTRPASPPIDALYGKANQIGTFGGSDLGPAGPFESG